MVVTRRKGEDEKRKRKVEGDEGEDQFRSKQQKLEQSLGKSRRGKSLLCEIVQQNSDNYKIVVILDMFWVGHMSRFWNLHNKDDKSKRLDQILFKYCLGSLPTANGRAWEEAEIIYVPFNVEDKHWVALQIDFTTWVVHIYDSNVDLYDTKFVENPFYQQRGLPLELKQYEPMAKHLEKWGEKPLSFNRANGLKSNKQGGDCGVYTLKYIEALTTKKCNIFDIEVKLIDGYRSYLANNI